MTKATEPAARANDDRRQEEYGPPKGWEDRRRTAERRTLEFDECIVSESDWLLYFASTSFSAEGGITKAVSDNTADVFCRVRN